MYSELIVGMSVGLGMLTWAFLGLLTPVRMTQAADGDAVYFTAP